MNKLLRQFLSGGSLAALQLCALGGGIARAAGTTINNYRSNVVINTNKDYILVTPSGYIGGNLTNNATVGVNSFGIEVQSGAGIGGQVINGAAGVINASRTGIAIQSGVDLVGGINNAGKIQVAGTSGSVHAVDYLQTGGQGLNLTNSGTILVSATGTHSNNAALSDRVRGVFENDTNAHNASPTLTLTNSGAVTLKAGALVQATAGSTTAEASAEYGLVQQANQIHSATLNLTNSAALRLQATAKATNTASRAFAFGSAKRAIVQSAVASHLVAGTVIAETLSNSGALSLAARGTASALNAGTALGRADAGSAMVQFAERSADAELSLTNSGQLNLAAFANAKAVNGNADGIAVMTDILRQQAINAGGSANLAGKANLTLTNSGAMSLFAQAKASGTEAESADAVMVNVEAQFATRAGMVNEKITNTNTGSMSLVVHATAVAQGSSGSAHARINDVFEQFARDTGVSAANSSITQAISNSASLALVGTAKITGLGGSARSEQASATFENVFNQTARDVVATVQSITNSGILTASAKATALHSNAHVTGSGYQATARAGVARLFQQNATGTHVTSRKAGSKITQAVSNTGALTLGAVASAQAKAGTATGAGPVKATAFIERVFYQQAQDATTISQGLTNSAALQMNATALAKFTGTHTERALANGTVHDVFQQHASGNYFPGAAIAQTISNSGSIGVGAQATALAAAGSGAGQIGAAAKITHIFYQSAENAVNVTQAITNSGALNLTAAAKATELARTIYITQDHVAASIGGLFLQSATTGSGAAHSTATQSISNSGVLTLTVAAAGTRGVAAQTGAFGIISVDARIDHVFSQTARNAVTIAQTVANTGAIVIKAAAAATAAGSAHKAYVRNSASHIVYQDASGDDLTGSAVTQSVSNTASIGITLSAKAKAQNGSSNANAAIAIGVASNLFQQRVTNALNAAQILTNSGAITIKANATATGVGHTASASASAHATHLFRQTFTADNTDVDGGTVSQAITNSGAIGLTLTASGNGQINLTSRSGAFALVNASHVFSQKANLSNSGTGTLSQTINNTGTITISETATATTTKDRADADAESFATFRQRASESGNVTQTLTSGAAISATLAATAKGATQIADARAILGSIIRQSITESNKATESATISNSGSITVNVTASAVAATAGKRALAAAFNDDPIVAQYASNDEGAISQSFTNNAAIKLTYGAIATGVTEANAYGRFSEDFAVQEARGGTSSAQTITNTGAITIAVSGRAKAKALASAIATMGSKLWAQTANNSGKPASQSITNTGNVSVSLVAAAVGTTKNALAKANYTSWFVNQSADGSNLGVLTQSITNSGALSLAATAVANGKTHASARANFDTVIRQEGRDYTDVTQTITNSGAISLNSIAKALAPNAVGTNQARAHFDIVMFQSAQSNLITTAPGIFINQTITNSGAISIKNAATATGAGRVTATAAGDHFIKQYEEGGGAVTQKLNNSGVLTVASTAKGKTTGNSTAFARVGQESAFLSQLVNQSSKTGQVANLSITNSGAISIGGVATATGLHEARAEASMDRVFNQSAGGNVSAILAITNSATIGVNETAKANGKGSASAQASVDLASQEVFERSSTVFTNAGLSLTNSGKVTLVAAGTAIATNSAKAQVNANGAWQEISLDNTKTAAPTGSLSVNNSGTISLTATAKATAGNRVRASASATGVGLEFRQSGNHAGTSNLSGTISFANSGTISVAANATVLSATPHVALAGATPSFVYADAIGLNVFAAGRNVTAHVSGTRSTAIHRTVTPTLALNNSGTMSVAAVAVGAGVDNARATATAAGMVVRATSQIAQHGTSQHSTGTFEHSTKQFGAVPVKGALSNSGTLTVSATATGGRATAGGINVEGSVHNESITNAVGGSLSVAAAGATALAGGINLSGFLHRTSETIRRDHNTATFTSRNTHTGAALLVPATNITGTITNSGTMTVSATGTVQEQADGILVNAARVSNTILNTGVMNITAAGPAALANGIHLAQSNYGTTNTSFFRNPVVGANSSGNATHHVRTRIASVAFAGVLNNTGTITVTANASTGNGSANGIDIEGTNLNGGSILNAGTINAVATGPTAIANGVLLSGGGAVSVSDRLGTINATATSSSGAATANGVFLSDGTLTGSSLIGGGGNITANGANGASANGWLIQGAGKLVMNGSGGVLNVNATATKGTASANGINVQGGSLTGTTISNNDTINTHATGIAGTTPTANAILVVGTGAVTVLNSGGTLSSLVTLAGATSYGTVINVTGASAAAITLAGGTIAGNIVEASGGNAITVSGGNTLFNGAINPSKALLGSVTVASTGTLTLGLNGGLGAGNVWTGSFVQQGALAINATTDTTVEGTIHAATATLSGPAVLNIDPSGAAIPLSSTYKVVFTTGTLSGTWSSVTVVDPTFLTAAGVYTANEADITLTRKSLGSISGLTPNEQAVGNALETIYEAGGGTGPLGKLTSALFALTPTQYADALQQLSGETVGDLVATDAADLQNMVDTVISHLDEDSASGVPGGTALNSMGLPGVHPAQDEDMGPISVWGGFIASGSQVSTTISSPSYHTHMNGLMAGADFAVSTNTLLGIAVGYNNGGLRTANDRGSFNVLEVSGYGRYQDPNDPWYALADISYGGFSNKLDRTISIPGLATSTVSGKFDTSTLALYGEAGYHLDSDIKLTPYAAISYLNADADPFTETGSFVAPLSVAKSSSNATISYLGAWFSQTWMSDNLAITPSIKAAWEHDFNSNAWTVNASFAPVSTAGFGINGSAMSQDAAFIDAGVSINGGDNVTFGLNYQGRVSSDRTESSIVGRIVFKF